MLRTRGLVASFVVLAAAACRGSSVPSAGLSAPSDAGSDASADASVLAVGEPPLHPCSLPSGKHGRGIAEAKPYAREDGTCSTPFCDEVEVGPKDGGACFVARKNLRKAERESFGGAGQRSVSAAWDRKQPPKYWSRVDGHLHLNEDESALLQKNGFVVLDRLGYGSYAVAYHDVFQQQLPVYVGIDAILNAVYQANQMLLAEVERTRLGPKLVKLLTRMDKTLARSRAVYDAETFADLELYLTVAERLLGTRDEEARTVSGVDEAATEIVASASGASGLAEIEIFGRSRMIDYSQYQPRGHYADGDISNTITTPQGTFALSAYFRAMTWLSRLEWNLVSRSCRSSQPGDAPDPSETPREAKDAIALADLVARSGSLEDLRAFEEVYSVFAGKREDVSIPDLLALSASAGIRPRDADAQKKLAAAIGDRFRRTARTHFMPQGSPDLPAITTLFGPRIVPDVAPLTRLVHDAVPDRYKLGAADVAYVLGHDRAASYLGAELSEHATLRGALDASRHEIARETKARKDVYGAWLRAVTALGERESGAVPTFMRTEAFADARMSSALAGYAQIRHTFVLVAGQGYDAYGCEIPDGWVEPALPVYDALLSWVAVARAAVPQRAAYFARVTEVLSTLRQIARTELSGAALTEPQRRWLAMVSEYTPVGGSAGDSGEPPKYTGWYFDLFPDREIGAERAVDLVADYFTLTNAGEVRYLGIEKAALGVFVVDVGGEPRAMVGPVVKPYETTSPIAGRLNDAAARKATNKDAPWLGYVAAAKPEPSLRAELTMCKRDARVVVTPSAGALGDVTIELLDHHGDPITEPLTLAVGDAPAVFAFEPANAFFERPAGIEGMHVRVHDLAKSRVGKGRFDVVAGPSTYASTQVDTPALRLTRLDPHKIALGAMAPPVLASGDE